MQSSWHGGKHVRGRSAVAGPDHGEGVKQASTSDYTPDRKAMMRVNPAGTAFSVDVAGGQTVVEQPCHGFVEVLGGGQDAVCGRQGYRRYQVALCDYGRAGAAQSRAVGVDRDAALVLHRHVSPPVAAIFPVAPSATEPGLGPTAVELVRRTPVTVA
jgi:hypothetical protein